VILLVMAPNSHELFFSESQNLVSAQFPVLDDVDNSDHFARTFRDELVPPAILREREELGIPDLVIDRPPFIPAFIRGRGILEAAREVAQARRPDRGPRDGWLERSIAIPRTPGRGRGRPFAEIEAEYQAFLRGLGRGHGRGQRQ
jgi:hypothetical protein